MSSSFFLIYFFLFSLFSFFLLGIYVILAIRLLLLFPFFPPLPSVTLPHVNHRHRGVQSPSINSNGSSTRIGDVSSEGFDNETNHSITTGGRRQHRDRKKTATRTTTTTTADSLSHLRTNSSTEEPPRENK